MPEENVGLDLAKEAVGVVAGKTYDDVAHPALQAVGSIIGLPFRVIDAALAPVKIWVEEKKYNYERTVKTISEKMRNVESEKITPPENYVAIPALQQIAYCYDSEELRNMYANLLAASMNIDTKWDVHPAFVDLIKQLTPDEAKLLRGLQSQLVFPVIHVKQYMKDGKSFSDVVIDHTELGKYCDCSDRLSSYLSNLKRLELIRIDYSTCCTYDGAYDSLDNEFSSMKAEWEKYGCKFVINHGLLELTPFGREFSKIVIIGT